MKHLCQEEILFFLFFLEPEINMVPPRKIKSLGKRGVIKRDKREILCNERFSTRRRNFLDVTRIMAVHYDIPYWQITCLGREDRRTPDREGYPDGKAKLNTYFSLRKTPGIYERG